mmetsp:Transcript_29262/g.73023  ORF Transcript_29262/g.73023 Transcript_29262/m.73023 type:complete len:95 (+) Transcript_29262:816-1100(+)
MGVHRVPSSLQHKSLFWMTLLRSPPALRCVRVLNFHDRMSHPASLLLNYSAHVVTSIQLCVQKPWRWWHTFSCMLHDTRIEYGTFFVVRLEWQT